MKVHTMLAVNIEDLAIIMKIIKISMNLGIADHNDSRQSLLVVFSGRQLFRLQMVARWSLTKRKLNGLKSNYTYIHTYIHT